MKKKMITLLTATTMLVSSVVSLASCKDDDQKGGGSAQNAREIYAMSAVSSVSYLMNNESGTQATGAADGAMMIAPLTAASGASGTVRPSGIVDNDVAGIQSCLAMFDNMITDGGVDQTVTENTSEDPRFSAYPLEMKIGLHDVNGNTQSYSMYFREINSETEKEIDDGVEEIEVSTTFEGVIVYGNELFVVEGEREVETEGNETETSMEFATYKNVGSEEVVADRNNYVLIEQSFENTEVEYEYTFYKNGAKVQEMEIEYEQERNGREVSFEWTDVSTGVKNETEYTVKAGATDGTFVVELEKNNAKDNITVTKLAEGGYEFVYSNGYSEVVG